MDRWKTITLALKERKLPIENWERVMPDALHSIRSLISTSTNETPHERLFRYARRSSSGASVPSWLLLPGPVLLTLKLPIPYIYGRAQPTVASHPVYIRDWV